MTFEEAMQDILEYLAAQDDEYFFKKRTTRQAVMDDKERLVWCAQEHKKCVESFGVERGWSCKDACDNAPGIVTG